MKKSWILLVLAALLVFALAIPATAADASTPHCYCGGTTSTGHKVDGCTGNLSQTWTAYSGTTLPKTSGYYYLTGNISDCGQATVKNVDIYVDLNGKTVTMNSDARTYHLNGSVGEKTTVTITDFVGGGTIKAAGTGDFVGAIFKTYTTVATVNIYGGILDANGHNVSKAEEAEHGNGGAALWIFGTVNMYGGTIKGGSASGSDDGYGGGNVFLSGPNTKFNMYGGTITGGSAAKGGNIYIYKGAQLNMYGGVIENGSSTITDMRHGGGNIYVLSAASKINMSGGTIRDGLQKGTNGYGSGGNVCLRQGAFTMTGGTISNSTTDYSGNYGGNVALTHDTASFNMTGGTLSGGKTVNGGASVAAVMNGGNITIGGTAVINGGVTPYGGAIWVGSAPSSASVGARTSAKLTITGGTINGGDITQGGSCIEIRDGDYSGTKYPSQVTISGGTIDARNGNAKYGGAIDMQGTSTIDMSGGTIYGGPTFGSGGGAMIIQGGTVNMTGGTIYGGSGKDGGAILLFNSSATGNFIMNGANAKIIGGTASNSGGVIKVQNAAKTFTLKNGTVDGSTATAKFGAAVSVSANGNFVMQGGTLTGGTASGSCGGAIALQPGKVTISGGTVNGGKLGTGAVFGGGSIAVIDKGGVCNITGGTFNGGTAKQGANFYVYAGTMNISGGTFKAGTKLDGGDSPCGRVCGTGTVTITGGTIAAIGKFGGTLNVSGAPSIDLIALSNNQYFSLPAELTADVTVSHDDWSDDIAVAASNAIAVASKEHILPWPGALVIEDNVRIHLAAVQAYKDGAYDGMFTLPSRAGGEGYTYKMTGNISAENINLASGTVLDLNGFTLSVSDTATIDGVVLIDSATADYDSTNDRGYGVLDAATVSGTPARSGVDSMTNYRYLTIRDSSGNYSAHRIYVAIKSAVLAPNGPSVNFRTVFRCDEVVAGLIGEYGAQFSGTSTVKSVSTNAIASGADNDNAWITTLANASAANFESAFTSHAYIVVNDSWATASEKTVISSQMARSVQSMVEYASANLTTMNVYQTNALVNMYKKYSDNMVTWSVDALAKKASGDLSTT